ncbi:MAG TPA: hypothetical protein VLF38_08915, partial [Nocardioides sp.]|nr:hypothetical protein [Nocardioides sp.]
AGVGSVQLAAEGELSVTGLDARTVGDLAFDNQIRVHELSTHQATLEEAFLEMTGNASEYNAQAPAPSHAPAPTTPQEGTR